jgi:hypothetical protein
LPWRALPAKQVSPRLVEARPAKSWNYHNVLFV